MDDDDDGFRNWGYYEPSFKGHLDLQLMPSVTERDAKAARRDHTPNVMANLNREGYQHQPQINHHSRAHPQPHYAQEFHVSETPLQLQYTRDYSLQRNDKFLSILPGNPCFGVMPEAPGTQSLHMMEHSVMLPKTEMVVKSDDPEVKGATKKRQASGAPKILKAKKPKKTPLVKKANGNNISSQRVKPPKKNVDVNINGTDMDISSIPIPVCTCTGNSQQCYRWGCGGWQSACCTTSISVYPLPMSTKRRGARIAGRKMSMGAFKKVLEKLSSEGYDFSLPIDLKIHWARHGTNKFVTIR